jgi:carbohydrate-selective porin OprB
MNKPLHRMGASAIVLAIMCAGVSAPAAAQSATSSADTGMFPGVTALGQTLKNDGIYLQLGYTQIVASLVSGGFQTGTFPTGELYFGTVLDLQTILGIPGASFHITFDERSGYAINANVGTQGPLNETVGRRVQRVFPSFSGNSLFSTTTST